MPKLSGTSKTQNEMLETREKELRKRFGLPDQESGAASSGGHLE